MDNCTCRAIARERVLVARKIFSFCMIMIVALCTLCIMVLYLIFKDDSGPDLEEVNACVYYSLLLQCVV